MKLIIQAPQSTKFSVDEIRDIKKRVLYAETLSLTFQQEKFMIWQEALSLATDEFTNTDKLTLLFQLQQLTLR